MGNSISLQDELINLKMTSKQMISASKKCEQRRRARANNTLAFKFDEGAFL